jgi:hypothetical protein
MQNMNEFQNRLWEGMLESIVDFRNGRLTYSDLVGKLEGALDASDIKNDTIIKEWYNCWTPLEIERATKGNNIEKAVVENYIRHLEEFIRDKISRTPSHQP